MHVLHRNNIVDIFVWVDDSLPKQLPNPRGGRPAKLTTSEMVTILLFSSLYIAELFQVRGALPQSASSAL